MHIPPRLAFLLATILAASPASGQEAQLQRPSNSHLSLCPCSPLPKSIEGAALCPDNKWMSKRQGAYHSVRSVDFANFSFPWLSMHQGTFKLTHGSLSPTRSANGWIEEVGLDLVHVDYGDVTGDGIEEAIVVLAMTTGGSATPHWVFVYSPTSALPSLIWAFETGDRADAGLRKVFADKGNLILEFYDPEGSRGDCCPVRFTRTRLRLAGGRFCPSGEPETIKVEEP